MKIRSGLPIWRAIRSPERPITSLTGDDRCEVAVIGGGVTGALTAYLFVQAGINTVLVDKREPAEGSTAASTGLLQYEVDTPLVDLAAKVGVAAAVHAYRRGLRAIDELESLVDELDEPCGFARRDTLYFSSHWWHNRRLRQECAFRKQHGFDVRLLSKADLARQTSIPASVAIRSTGDAEIDPYRLTLALLRGGQAKGLRVHSHAKIDAIDQSDHEFRLKTGMGTIVARRVVCAAGYESDQFLDRPAGTLHSTYALASEPLASQAGWPERCLIWETARPYFYARQSEDGRAIVGGGDTIFSTDHQRDNLLERKVVQLAARFMKLFPAIELTPEFAWGGTFGETPDGLAYLGEAPGHPHMYFALGYGGNGITFSMIAARLILDLYLGRPNQDAAVFAFDR